MSPRLPVTLVFYRRPARLAEVLARVRSYRPPVLFAVSDGAPPGEPGVADQVRAARKLVEEGIDWPCEVHRDYAEKNLGLRRRFETGLDGVFARTDFSIILEEDCLPRPDFFPFLEEVETRWRKEPRVASISGNCFLPKAHPLATSYFFSRYPHIWGWGTWARAWAAYDRDARGWSQRGGTRAMVPEMKPAEARYWDRVLGRVYAGELVTWDYRWLVGCWSRGWWSVTPAENLVENRGFGPEATNTRDPGVATGIERVQAMRFPLHHPARLERDLAADEAVFRNHYRNMEGRLPLWSRWGRSLAKRLGIRP